MSWAMVRGGRVWHFWRGDIAACGRRRRSAWTLGSVGAGDCPTCATKTPSRASSTSNATSLQEAGACYETRDR